MAQGCDTGCVVKCCETGKIESNEINTNTVQQLDYFGDRGHKMPYLVKWPKCCRLPNRTWPLVFCVDFVRQCSAIYRFLANVSLSQKCGANHHLNRNTKNKNHIFEHWSSFRSLSTLALVIVFFFFWMILWLFWMAKIHHKNGTSTRIEPFIYFFVYIHFWPFFSLFFQLSSNICKKTKENKTLNAKTVARSWINGKANVI